ncbi:MAG TPA: ABC transporter permease [Bacteroidia bacterium]|nr:ABC transporter permease [Bacteroidia bacterium]HNT81127.1 ABC transporter permease [Bacteroidia bacterium]
MNIETFIAKRILFNRSSGMMIRPVIRLAVLSVALGIAVMVCSVMIISGFKRTIVEKLTGFSAHIQISSFNNNNSYEVEPIEFDSTLYQQILSNHKVEHLQVYATKAGIIKYKDEFQGTLVKGVNNTFDVNFFKDKLVKGMVPDFSLSEKSNQVLISSASAQLLQLDVDSSFLVYFIQDPPRYRKLTVAGIYETGLGEFDELYLIADVRHIQKLNDWGDNQFGGYEVFVKDFSKVEEVNNELYQSSGFNYNCQSVKELYPQVFSWLDLQNMNVWVIIILMFIVAGMNMVSTLLIVMLEQTNLIGILKALGAYNFSIKKIFVRVGSYLAIIGIVFGNLIALTLGYLQVEFELFKLDQASYYMNKVPIHFDLYSLLLLNLGTFILCVALLFIPARFVTKVNPVEAMRFD